jgi:hypothetical protein
MTPADAVVLRPKFSTRKSSGTMIVPRDAPNVELKEGEEVFDEGDARAMSPRRNSDILEKMRQEARAQLSLSVQAYLPILFHLTQAQMKQERFSLTRFLFKTRKTAR